MNDVAELYRLQGKYAQAEPLAIKTLEISRRVLGDEHTETLANMNGLGVLYRCEGKHAQAEPLLTKSLEARLRLLGDQHPDTLASRSDLAALYRTENKYAQAAALFTPVLEARRRVLGRAHPDTTEVMVCLAEVRLQQKQYVAAESLLREDLNNEEKTAPGGWRRFRSQSAGCQPSRTGNLPTCRVAATFRISGHDRTPGYNSIRRPPRANSEP